MASENLRNVYTAELSNPNPHVRATAQANIDELNRQRIMEVRESDFQQRRSEVAGENESRRVAREEAAAQRGAAAHEAELGRAERANATNLIREQSEKDRRAQGLIQL